MGSCMLQWVVSSLYKYGLVLGIKNHIEYSESSQVSDYAPSLSIVDYRISWNYIVLQIRSQLMLQSHR